MEYIEYTQFDPSKLSFKIIETKNKCPEYSQKYIIPMYSFDKNKIKRFNVKWPFLPINFSLNIYDKDKPWRNGFRINLNNCKYEGVIKMLQEYDKKFEEFINKNLNNVDSSKYENIPILNYKDAQELDTLTGKMVNSKIIKCIYPHLMKSRKEKDKFSTEIINYNGSVFKNMYDTLKVYEYSDIEKIFDKPYKKSSTSKEGRLLMTFRACIPKHDFKKRIHSQILPYKMEIKDTWVKIRSVIDNNEIRVEPEMTKVVI